MIRKKRIISVNSRLDDWVISRNRARAWFLGRNFRKFPCKKCGLFGCICQVNLLDWIKPKVVLLKDRCPVCGLFLCSCSRNVSGLLVESPK